MEINTNYIKVSGKAELPEPLELGESYKIMLDGEIISSTDSNNQNGTFDRSFLFKPALATIEDKHGKVLKAKDIRSRSTQLRRMIYRFWEADTSDMDSEQAYDRTMKYILLNVENLYEEAKRK